MNPLYLFGIEAKQAYGKNNIDKTNFEYVLELKAIQSWISVFEHLLHSLLPGQWLEDQWPGQ